MPPMQRPPRVKAYLDDVVRTCNGRGDVMASVVLFGSASTGGYSTAISDVDLLLVLRDGATAEERQRVRETVSEVEARHGLAKHPAGRQNPLQTFVDRLTANVRSFFVCTRADLLSGEPWRILDIPRAQGRFVDRIAIPSIVGSGITVWGEELLDRVPLPPIRRRDVAKSFFALFNQVLFTAVAYPLLRSATRYAMDALKRSVHSCYFCHHRRPAPLAVEIAFLQERHGSMDVLTRLLALRRDYRPSFGFVMSCLPTLARLHLGAVRDGVFPRDAHPRA